MNSSRIRMTPWLLTLATILAVSPFFHAFSPIKGNVISILALLVILIIKASWRGINVNYLFWCFLILFLASISASYWIEPRMWLLPKYFILSVLVISVLNKSDIKAFVKIQTTLVLMLLFGAVIGTMYAYFGGVPILKFDNPDGRLNQLYLTTLTNVQFGNFIRPSGIFDEPGALSFITCFVAALRHSMGCNKKITWLLLLLGFITASVAHLIYVLLHAAEEIKNIRRAVDVFKLLAAALFLLVFIALFQPINDLITTTLLNRFSGANFGSLGQDRGVAMMNAIGYIDINSFMFGVNSDCAVGLVNCSSIGFNNYGDNPLTLLVHWGAFLAFPYYFALLYLLVRAARQRSFILFGIFLLLLQRPYVMSYGYSMLILFTIFVLVDGRAGNGIRIFRTRNKRLNALPSV
jgi:hypothetical protein